MTKIIITGINGFVGKHVAHELKSRGVSVIGVGREPAAHPSLTEITDAYYACDLTIPEDVDTLPLRDIDAVINLAGFAAVGASYGQDELYMRVNVGVLRVIGESILKRGLNTRMLAISTGAVYSPNQPLPLHENSTLISSGSPYALSKIAMEQEAIRLRELGLDCIIARPFNHIGPGQEPGFLVPDLYQKMVQAIKDDGLVKVGDLTTKRDYTDVRDVAKAYADLVLCKTLDEDIYNICTGHSVPGSTIFDLLASNLDGAHTIKPEVDQSFLRPGDPKELYGNNDRLRTQTGWTPAIPIEQTIRDFVANKQL
jgi:GDP-4-dehydro-6-deoxy-D-mannose reductase